MTGKRFLIVLCVAFCLILAGCGEKQAEIPPADSTDAQNSAAPTEDVKKRTFEAADVETILAADAFSEELEPVDVELVYGLYGLSADAVTGCTAYMSTGASAEEVVLFTVADESGVAKIENACEWRLEDQTFGYKDYMPDELPKLENAIVEVRGNTVLFVVANDWESAAKAISELD